MSYFTFCDLQFYYADTFFQHLTLYKTQWQKELLTKRDALLMGTVNFKKEEKQIFKERLLF